MLDGFCVGMTPLLFCQSVIFEIQCPSFSPRERLHAGIRKKITELRQRITSGLLVCLAGILPGGVAHFQVTTFTKWFGGPKYDAGFCAQPLTDGGFILVGTTLTLTNSWDDVFAIRTDCAGDTVWTHAIGGSSGFFGWIQLGIRSEAQVLLLKALWNHANSSA